uniref:Poly(A) RNA polymerase cid11 n=1 Tax=Anthurium amnicola TaxID=1678845 RepID=A0A1D1XFY8_9ARAE
MLTTMDYRHSSHANGTMYSLLESSLDNILSFIKPLEEDRLRRLNTINDVRNAIQPVASLKGAAVNPFGSFISNLYTKWGDLDISIQVSPSPYSSVGRKQKQNLLRDIMKVLRKTGWGTIQFIPQARVPLLVFESRYRNISCDISIDNHVGQIKSKMFLWLAEIDGRFRDMVLLIKEWAKAHNINDPKAGTLNSYSLCLLVIFHFQTCSPAILPPLKDIYGGNLADDFTGMRFVSERQIEDLCAANIAKFRSQGGKNDSTLQKLLTSFFEKFCRIQNLATVYVICTYSGKWESIWNNPIWMEKRYQLFVEDPFEIPDNAARAVAERGLPIISNAFADTYRSLSSARVLSDRNALLSILVRPHVVPQIGRTPGIQHSNHGAYGYENRIEANYARTQGTHVQTYTRSGVPLHYQFKNVLELDSDRPSSSSTSSPRRQGAGKNREQTWKPRYS